MSCLRHGAVVPIAALSLLGLTLLPASLRGQDSHYWNLSYGTQATLLGGAVIGSVSDLSATYYNPGMLAVNREQGLLLGANVYQYQRFSIDQVKGKEATSSRIRPAPGLVAGRVPVDSSVIGGIAYSILSRQFYSVDLKNYFAGQADFNGGDAVPEDAATELALTEDLSETWIGVTAFRLLSPGVGVGFTNYVAVRNQNVRNNVAINLRDASGSLGSTGRIRDVEYYDVRLLWKAGVGVDLGSLTLGLTVTTPSVNLFGSGSAYLRSTSDGMAAPGDTAGRQFLIASYQEDLSARYRSSWAIGAGAGYRLGGTRIHASAEWYAPVSGYEVLETSDFNGQSDGLNYSIPVVQELTSVFNVGVGVQIEVSDAISAYGSFTTDFSGSPKSRANTIAVTTWDLYHLTAGTVLSFESIDLTLGISYASGKAPFKDIGWSVPGGQSSNLDTIFESAVLRSATLTGLLAVTFRL